VKPTDTRALEYRALLAPGTPLRAGLERIQAGRTGALIVIGNTEVVRRISTGGFHLDAPFTPTGLRELAKLDGAIVVTAGCERIVAAGVQLMPDPSLATLETGTRHRTADRTAQQTGCAVITVSASMNTIALFLGDERHPIEPPATVLGRANMALQTLERYRGALRQALARLSVLEVQDQVTIRDLILVGQRLEMVLRLEQETASYVTELGTDGRLIGLQLLDVDDMVAHLPRLLTADYRADRVGDEDFHFGKLADLSDAELIDPAIVARTIGFTESPETLVTARGYRQLAEIQRLPTSVAGRVIDHFDGLQGILGATSHELRQVEGVGDSRARMIRDALSRTAEQVFLESAG
jgi:diadenylate cyclase